MGVTQKVWNGTILSVSEDPIISVKEARKMLGKEYKELSDDNLLGVINSLHKIAFSLLESIIVPNKEMVY